MVSREGICADPKKVETVKDWPAPTNVREVRQFIGFASYYREFQPSFANTVFPLQRLITQAGKSGDPRKKIVWSSECQQAFDAIKLALTTAPILGYPKGNGWFILDTDASGFAMAGVLSQEQGGKEVVLSYASNSFNDRQRNYCTTKRELLAVVTYLNKFRHFIQYQGDNFIIRTDHASLK